MMEGTKSTRLHNASKGSLTIQKRDPEKQENYRPISLLNTFYKIIAAAMPRRLASSLDHLLMKTQYGFRKNKSTINALFVAKRMQEYAERAGHQGMMILLDWEKAFDKISHEWLFKALEYSDTLKRY